MLTLRNLWCRRGFSAICAIGLCVSSFSAVFAQDDDEGEPATPYRDAYIAYVDRQLSEIQSQIAFQRSILNARGGELLDEIGIRLQEKLALLPPEMRQPGIPEPPEIVALREYEQTLSNEVVQIEDRILSSADMISEQRDSVAGELKSADAVRATVTELDRAITTDLELWKTKVDLVRSRLIGSGSADEGRRMFVTEYNALVSHYDAGDYRSARARLTALATAYGDLPLPEWRERLLFYRAEIDYAMGDWDNAFRGYMEVWQRPRNEFASVALLNWTELAFAAGEHRKIATMWTSQPRLPEDVVDANRIRVLVAESFLRLNEPQVALSVLNLVQTALPPAAEDAADDEETKLANDRLVVYSRLLRAEAHLGGDSGAGAQGSIASEEALPEITDSALDSMLAATGGTPQRGDPNYYSRMAYLIASGQVQAERAGRQAGIRVAAAVKELEDVVPLVGPVDPEGTLMARVSMSLGHAYFQANRMEDAARAYGAVPNTSVWYPEAQLGRAWAFVETGNYLDAKIAVNTAQRWPLSPPAALEAAALNSYVLSLIGETELAAEQMREMKSMVDIQQRRAARVWVNQQLQKIDGSLHLVGIIALERQNEALYRSAIEEQASLLALREQVQRVERYLQSYTPNATALQDSLTVAIRAEQEALRGLEQKVANLRRAAGQTPAAASNLPEVTYEQRREQLQRWLQGVQPQMTPQGSQVYGKWVQYAEFAYSRRVFDENQRRRYEADRLKDVRTRIQKLLSESP